MKQTLPALCASLLLAAGLFSTPVLADSPVELDMQAMAKAFKAASHADDAAQLQASLEQLKAAATHAKGEVPEKFKDEAADGPNRQAYQQGLDQLIGQVDQALGLLKDGKLDEAKALLEEINSTKRTYHKKLDA